MFTLRERYERAKQSAKRYRSTPEYKEYNKRRQRAYYRKNKAFRDKQKARMRLYYAKVRREAVDK